MATKKNTDKATASQISEATASLTRRGSLGDVTGVVFDGFSVRAITDEDQTGPDTSAGSQAHVDNLGGAETSTGVHTISSGAGTGTTGTGTGTSGA